MTKSRLTEEHRIECDAITHEDTRSIAYRLASENSMVIVKSVLSKMHRTSYVWVQRDGDAFWDGADYYATCHDNAEIELYVSIALHGDYDRIWLTWSKDRNPMYPCNDDTIIAVIKNEYPPMP